MLRPLGLRNTQASQTPAIPPPVLHTYSSERRQFLGIPAGTPFLEDSTFWNPSWTFARGSIETTDITDLTRTAIDIGQGRLLTRSDYRMQIAPRLGFGHEQDGCLLCRKLTPAAGYGLGVFRVGPWIEAQPYFGGLGSVMVTCRRSVLPSRSSSPWDEAPLAPMVRPTTTRGHCFPRSRRLWPQGTRLRPEMGGRPSAIDSC